MELVFAPTKDGTHSKLIWYYPVISNLYSIFKCH